MSVLSNIYDEMEGFTGKLGERSYENIEKISNKLIKLMKGFAKILKDKK